MDAQIKAMFNQSTQYRKRTSKSGNGDYGFAEAVLLKCLSYGKTTLVKTSSGEEFKSTRTMLIDALDAPDLSEQDTVTVSGKILPIISVAPYPDEYGNTQVFEVFL